MTEFDLLSEFRKLDEPRAPKRRKTKETQSYLDEVDALVKSRIDETTNMQKALEEVVPSFEWLKEERERREIGKGESLAEYMEYIGVKDKYTNHVGLRSAESSRFTRFVYDKLVANRRAWKTFFSAYTYREGRMAHLAFSIVKPTQRMKNVARDLRGCAVSSNGFQYHYNKMLDLIEAAWRDEP